MLKKILVSIIIILTILSSWFMITAFLLEYSVN